MMGVEAPETCWATNERQVINLWNCCIWLVNLSESESGESSLHRISVTLSWNIIFPYVTEVFFFLRILWLKFSLRLAAWHVCLFLIFITLNFLCKENKSWSSSWCSFIHPPVTFSLFWNVLSKCVSGSLSACSFSSVCLHVIVLNFLLVPEVRMHSIKPPLP